MRIGSTQIVPIKDFRQRLKQYCEQVNEGCDHVVVMRHSKPMGVFLSKPEYDKLVEAARD